jgi:hypothetical protein
MIPAYVPNRHQRKRAERLAAKKQPHPLAKKALALWDEMQAVHESGHVLAALRFGFAVEYLTAGKKVELATLTPGKPEAKIHFDMNQPARVLIMFHAGAAAVRLLCNQQEDGFGGSDKSDAAWAEKCIAEMKLQGFPTKDANAYARRYAEQLVRANEAQIRKLAAALQERRHLTGPAIFELFGGNLDAR